MDMQGAKKGLIVNSRDLCANASRAETQLTGQNRLLYGPKPVVRALGCGGAGKGGR
jgi:hypothetical protein